MRPKVRVGSTAAAAMVGLGAVAGCGGGQRLSVRQVERAFFQAGVPFQTEQDRKLPAKNPYLRPLPSQRPQPIVVPGRARPLSAHVLAVLSAVSPTTFTSELVYVFDSPSSVDNAARATPFAKWVTSNQPVMRAKIANVVIFAVSGGDRGWGQRVHAAIASLSRQSR